MDWQTSMNHAIDYIESNLSDEIDYSVAAQYVSCSSWEFQRVFSFMAQIPLSEYIRRRRLTLAAHDIQMSRDRIIDIAMRYGYSLPAGFSRAFSLLHGTTPSSARSGGVTLKAYPRLTFKFVLQGVDEMEFKIENKEAFDIIGYKREMTEADGAQYKAIGQMWQDFDDQNWWDVLSKYHKYPNGNDPNGNDPNGTNPNAMYCYSVSSYDNDESVRGGSFHYTIGALYNGKHYGEDRAKHKDLLETMHIPASSYAVFVMPSDEEAGRFTERIFREWLPSSGYKLTGRPELELSSSKTDVIVWLPVKE